MVRIRNLRLLRQHHTLPQEAIPDRSGIALSTIMRLQKDSPARRHVAVHKLAEALGVPAEKLAQPVEDVAGPAL